jgi:tetratricopeptide (TPR) repeat protein
MYLPLAALVVLGVSLVAWVSDHVSRMRYAPAPRTVAIAGVCAWAVVAASLAAGTVTRNREYSSRLELARLTLDRWPSGKARHGLALELWRSGRSEEAFAYLREALRDDARARFTLGRLLSETGRLREGREHLEEFVRREPLMIEAVEATALIGHAFLVDGQLDAAASRFRQVLFMQPSYWNAHLALGDILLAQRKFDDAIAEYRRYFALGGASDGAWINLGTAFARSGRVDEAIQALRRATELYPEAGEAHRNLAAVLLENGAVSEAVQHARQAVALRPADPLSRGLLGLAFVAERKLDEAINQFREAVRLDPSDAVAQEQLEQALQARELSPGG